MRVLVTGAAGFIGSNLCQQLTRHPSITQVIGIDDLSTGNRDNLAGLDRMTLHVGSILDETLLTKAATGVQAIVHLAALPSVPRSIRDPLASHAANATGTLMVLEAARTGCSPHVIVASSSSVYGSNPTLPKREEDYTRPLSPYAVTKSATEGYALAYQASFGLDALAFRFFNVYGPGQAAGHAYAAVIPQFLDAALRDQPLRVEGDGLQSRDFTYVGTVCDVIVRALMQRVSSASPVNLAFNTRTSLLDLIGIIESRLGRELRREFVEPRRGDVRASQADSTLLTSLFPDATPITLHEGISKTVTWFQSQREVLQ